MTIAQDSNITTRGDYCSLLDFNSTWLKPYNATYTLCSDVAQKCGKINLTSDEIYYNQTHPKKQETQTLLWSYYEPNKEKGLECTKLLVPFANVYWMPGKDFGGDLAVEKMERHKDPSTPVPSKATNNAKIQSTISLLLFISMIMFLLMQC